MIDFRKLDQKQVWDYNVIARLVKRGEIVKEGRRTYPLNENEPPLGGSDTGEVTGEVHACSDQSGTVDGGNRAGMYSGPSRQTRHWMMPADSRSGLANMRPSTLVQITRRPASARGMQPRRATSGAVRLPGPTINHCPFLGPMLDRDMGAALALQQAAGHENVGRDDRTTLNLRQRLGLKRFHLHIGDDLDKEAAAPLLEAHCNRFASRPATALARALAADTGFINLDMTGQQRSCFAMVHLLADFVTDPPGGLVGHAKLALQIFAAHAVASGDEKADCIEPNLQQCPRVLKDRADSRIDVM